MFIKLVSPIFLTLHCEDSQLPPLGLDVTVPFLYG